MLPGVTLRAWETFSSIGSRTLTPLAVSMVTVNKPQRGPVPPNFICRNEVTQNDNGDAQMGGTGTSRKEVHVGARPLDG